MPTATSDPTLDRILSDHMGMEGPLLPILHAVQAAFGHVPASLRPAIADALNISGAELHGVISFYHDFRNEPGGRHVLRICRAEACQAMGGTSLARATLEKLGVDWHGTTGDGTLTVEPVYCLGLCACAPAVALDDKVLGRATGAKIDTLLQEASA
jgi:formate dehydrogenase subunit gamma